MRVAAFFLLLLTTSSLWAQDSLFLNNQSILVGKIKTIDLATITFKADDITTLTVEMDKIKTLHVSSKLLRIETIFKQVYIGYLLSGDIPGTARVASERDTSQIFLTSIISIATLGHKFWDAVTGRVGAGYSYTRTSSIGRFNFDGNINYNREHIESSMTGTAIMTQDDSVFSRDREEYNAQVSYYYDPVWYNQVLFTYQRNLELSLKRRFQQGIGGGSRFLLRSNMQANVFTGIVVNQEVSTDGVSSGALSEIPIGFQYNFYRYKKPKLVISFSQTTFFGLNQSGRVRQDGKTKVVWKPISDFSISVDLYNNFDSKPPGGNTASIDYGIVFSIGYEF